MSVELTGDDRPVAVRGGFDTTRWSLVLAAGAGPAPGSREALAELCAAYWYPIYAHVRRRGHGPEEALDLTQGFFARVLEREIVRTADPGRGRFRCYLLGALTHFLADERDRGRALKRGGDRVTVSRDAADAEARYRLEPAHGETADRQFERRWATTLIGRVLAELRRRYAAEGNAALFEHLRGFLTHDPPAGTRAEAAAALGTSPGAARVALHRMRRRYRDLLREEIAQTVSSPDQVDAEIRDLFAAVRR